MDMTVGELMTTGKLVTAPPETPILEAPTEHASSAGSGICW